MKKFQIIEEGRLDQNQMAKVNGGKLVCTIGDGDGYNQGFGPGTVSCPNRYKSCGNGMRLTCNRSGGYIGQSGGAGIRDSFVTIF